MVITGPMLPVILMRVAPIRLIASLVKKLGIKVLKIAINAAINQSRVETIKSLDLMCYKKLNQDNNNADDIATLVKIRLPKREIKALLKIT